MRILTVLVRSFTTSPLSSLKKHKYPPRPKWLIVEEELDEKFIKGGSGPGGQKINKTNSKVQLTHLPTGIVVTSQYSRSQEKNRQRAREVLALKLEEMQNPDGCRNAIIAQAKSASKENKAKKARRKYRQLDEQRVSEVTEEPDPEAEFESFLNNYHGKS